MIMKCPISVHMLINNYHVRVLDLFTIARWIFKLMDFGYYDANFVKEMGKRRRGRGVQ